MIILITFAFLAGIVTILSPCILPILPIVLSSTVVGGKSRPFGIVTGFIVSFTFFTLFLTTTVKALGIPAESLRTLSIVVIFLFGLSLLIPRFQLLTEQMFSKLSGFMPRANKHQGFFGGIVIGLSIGLLWTPCVGPILASVISLALSGEVKQVSVLITLAYSLGTALPMLAILYGGQSLMKRTPVLIKNSANIQKAFGVLMIVISIGIYQNADRKIQTFILDTFPHLTKIEKNQAVQEALGELQGQRELNVEIGKPNINSLDMEGKAPEFIPGGEWLNSDPLTIKGLQGKVILVDFWTYTCINCIRTLPYLRAWHDKYADQGLVIVGVHTPEFEFEKSVDNLKKAIEDFELKYPIVQDNNYATWKAYNNHYWPAKYLIDHQGNIRYHHFGEGGYDETEKNIQQLLMEAGAEETNSSISNPTYDISSKTPELYLGYGRVQYLSSPERIIKNQPSQYSAPSSLPNNRFAYVGNLEVSSEFANPKKGAKLILNFEAKNVFLVMRPKDDVGTVRIMIDGNPPTDDIAGEDVKNGIITIDQDRLYKLIKLENSGRHTLELEFEDSNTEIFAFTFG